jgi:hypothetical protein
MKKITLAFLSVAIVSLFVVSACKKDEPEPAPVKTLIHSKGDTEGSVTVDGTTTTISGRSTENSFGFTMSPRNMNPPNSYPSLSISFASKPTKDSTYNLASSSAGISVYTDDSGNGYFDLSGGNLMVDYNGTSSTATFTNVTLTKSGGTTMTVSGSVTYYDDYIYQ